MGRGGGREGCLFVDALAGAIGRRMATAAFLDANVVLRYLLNDVPELAEQAARIIDSNAALLVTDVVIVEAAYVLLRQYGVPRAALVDDLIALIQRSNI